MSPQLKSIIAKFKRARELDARPCGYEKHGWSLNAALALSEIQAFEQKYGFSLPSGYREFITEFGDGGAGPGYGMFSLSEAVGFERLPEWERDAVTRTFPHVVAYNPENDPAYSTYYKSSDEQPITVSREDSLRYFYNMDVVAGTITLCDEGCNQFVRLVINGPSVGQMWMDESVEGEGFYPLGVCFLDWYENWLDVTITDHGLE